MSSLRFRNRRRLAALYKAARQAPVLCERHGKPRVVISSLSRKAGIGFATPRRSKSRPRAETQSSTPSRRRCQR
jgi:hypothetical protein